MPAPPTTTTAPKASGIGGKTKEILYWVLFSLLMSLAQLWLIPVICYAANKPWTLVGLIGDGSLLFFATTITSKTGGEYFRRVTGRHEWLTLGCVAMMLIILLPSVAVFGLEVSTRAGLMPATSLSPDRVTHLSLILAISGILFSLSYTLFIHNLANEGV